MGSLAQQREARGDLDYWATAPDFPVDDWKYEVANDETRRAYWDWVYHRRQAAQELAQMPDLTA